MFRDLADIHAWGVSPAPMATSARGTGPATAVNGADGSVATTLAMGPTRSSSWRWRPGVRTVRHGPMLAFPMSGRRWRLQAVPTHILTGHETTTLVAVVYVGWCSRSGLIGGDCRN